MTFVPIRSLSTFQKSNSVTHRRRPNVDIQHETVLMMSEMRGGFPTL